MKNKKNILCFGIILVLGFLMLGFVTSAGYNIVVPDAAVDGGSSGGGGGGGAASGAKTYVVSEADFLKGYSQRLAEGDGFKVSFGGDDHYIRLDFLTEETIKINVTSELQVATLSIGVPRRFEVTNDTFYDLSVLLNSIDWNVGIANITIKVNEEEITEESEAAEAALEAAAAIVHEEAVAEGGTFSEKNSFEFKWFYWIILGVVGLIIVGLILFFVLRKKK